VLAVLHQIRHLEQSVGGTTEDITVDGSAKSTVPSFTFWSSSVVSKAG